MNLNDLKSFTKYDNYLVHDLQGNILRSGDFIFYISNGSLYHYYVIEYVKYLDDIILLLHSRESSYYSTPIHEFPKHDNWCVEPFKIENHQIKFNKIDLSNAIKLSKQDKQFLLKLNRSIKYRLHWSELPELKLHNVVYFQAVYINPLVKGSRTSYIKLCNGKHEEYLWKASF